MKKLIAIFFAIAFFLFGCNQSKTFKVTLNLDNADGKTVYLAKPVDGKLINIDSAVISNKTAVLKADADNPQIAYIIRFDKAAECGILKFFSENKNMSITGDLNDMQHWTVKGCPLQDEYNAFHENSLTLYEEPLMALQDEIMNAFNTGDTIKTAELQSQLFKKFDEYNQNCLDYIKSHPDKIFAHYLLDEYKSNLELSDVEEACNSFTTESIYRQNVQKYIEQTKAQQPVPCLEEPIE